MRKKITKNQKMSIKEYQEGRSLLRTLVRIREDYQHLRIAIDNRMGRKASGGSQNLSDRKDLLTKDGIDIIESISKITRKEEEEIEKYMEVTLRTFPFYNNWLSKVKGVGTNHAAWIIGEIDIYKADNVSKITQFAGLNSGVIRGQKSVSQKEYKEEMGEKIGVLPPTKTGGKRFRILTDDWVRGDKRSPGFLCPFNFKLRMALCGRLADSFIKSQSPYVKHYYDLHVPESYRTDKAKMEAKPNLAGKYGRYDCSDQMTTEIKKGGKIVDLPWKETTDSHRDMAAKRKMIKEFLKDVYKNWRAEEGLPVREPYAEEYLGKEHSAAL